MKLSGGSRRQKKVRLVNMASEGRRTFPTTTAIIPGMSELDMYSVIVRHPAIHFLGNS